MPYVRSCSPADRYRPAVCQEMYREASAGCAQLSDLQLLLVRLRRLVTASGAHSQLARLRPRLLLLRGRLMQTVQRLIDCRRRLAQVRDDCDWIDEWLERTESSADRGQMSEDELEVRHP